MSEDHGANCRLAMPTRGYCSSTVKCSKRQSFIDPDEAVRRLACTVPCLSMIPTPALFTDDALAHRHPCGAGAATSKRRRVLHYSCHTFLRPNLARDHFSKAFY